MAHAITCHKLAHNWGYPSASSQGEGAKLQDIHSISSAYPLLRFGSIAPREPSSGRAALTHLTAPTVHWFANLLKLRTLSANTPAMPLYEAHFGGFFMLGIY